MFSRLIAVVLAVAVPGAACTSSSVEHHRDEGVTVAALGDPPAPGEYRASLTDAEGNPVELTGGADWATLAFDGASHSVDLAELNATQPEPELIDTGDGFMIDLGDGYTMTAVDAVQHPDGSVTVATVDSNGNAGSFTLGAADFEVATPGGVLFKAEDPKTWVDLVDKIISDPKARRVVKGILKPFGWFLKKLPYVLLALIITTIAACIARGGTPTLELSFFPPDIDVGCVFPPGAQKNVNAAAVAN